MTTTPVMTVDPAVIADLEAIMGEPGSVLTGVSSRAMNRFFCSSFETWRKNFTILVPLRSRWRSNPLMSS